SARRGRRKVSRGREAVAQARRGDACSGKELLVIKSDDLRTSRGLQIALEIGRNVDGGDGLAGPDRAGGGGEIAGAVADGVGGRGGEMFDEDGRGVGSVRIDDDNAEFADDRMTEHRGQDCEGKQRDSEDQYARCAVMQQPSPFAPGYEPESALGR